MSLKNQKPVVFLTFANAVEQGHLQHLKQESARLRDLFLPLHQRGAIELLREESLDNSELPKLLSQYKDQITIFHYAGHASEVYLSLEDGPGHAAGLADLLGLQSGLQLVFLNGCSTQAQALPYLEAGVPVVLATTRAVSDAEANYFSERFYHALLHHHTIAEAFQMAAGALKTRSDQYDSIERAPITVYRGAGFAKEEASAPWRLYVQEGKEAALDWKLRVQFKEEGLPKENPTDMTGPKGFRQKAWQWVAGAGVIIGILAGIAGFTGFDLKSLLGMAAPERPLQLTVYVHGPDGDQDMVLENEGQLVLDLRNDRRVAQIGEYGRTNFGEISRDFLGKAVPLSVRADDYVLAHPDSNYVFEGEPIYLEVKSSCRFCKLSGTVQDAEGRLVPGLVVMIKGTEWSDITGQNGRFEIRLPPEEEREEYVLMVIQEGRILWENYVTPSPGTPIEILLPH